MAVEQPQRAISLYCAIDAVPLVLSSDSIESLDRVGFVEGPDDPCDNVWFDKPVLRGAEGLAMNGCGGLIPSCFLHSITRFLSPLDVNRPRRGRPHPLTRNIPPDGHKLRASFSRVPYDAIGLLCWFQQILMSFCNFNNDLKIGPYNTLHLAARCLVTQCLVATKD